MNLIELKAQVDNAVELAHDTGEDPYKILVTLQIDGLEKESICANEELEVHYDNNAQASGCVIVAYRDEEDQK